MSQQVIVTVRDRDDRPWTRRRASHELRQMVTSGKLTWSDEHAAWVTASYIPYARYMVITPRNR